jgi:hypothetical protein
MVIRSKALDADLRRLAPQSGENLGYLGRSFQLHWARASHSAGLAAGGDIAAVNITPSIVFTISLASREKSKWKSFVVTISGMRCFALLAATVLLLRTVQPFDRTRSLSLSLSPSLPCLAHHPTTFCLLPGKRANRSQVPDSCPQLERSIRALQSTHQGNISISSFVLDWLPSCKLSSSSPTTCPSLLLLLVLLLLSSLPNASCLYFIAHPPGFLHAAPPASQFPPTEYCRCSMAKSIR